MAETVQPSPDGVERTATGTIVDQAKPLTTETPAATSDSLLPKTESESKPEETSSLLNQKPAEGAPDSYAQYKLPDGFELPEETSKEINGIFKGMNLSQASAQQLVDLYVKHTTEAQSRPFEAYKAMRQEWVEQAKAHPDIGGNLDRVKTTIGRALDGLGDAALANDFRAAMDLTGVGDHPAFIRAFYRMAQKLTEGSHVSGQGPAPVAQPGTRPTAASALYPNLPSAG
jgi:hypothetical protein